MIAEEAVDVQTERLAQQATSGLQPFQTITPPGQLRTDLIIVQKDEVETSRRPILDFQTGTNTTLAVSDDPAGNRTLIKYSTTGLASSAEAYVTIGNTAGLSAERALTGTSNQIVVTDNGANSTVVLSTPQDLHTAATPQFARMGLGAAADGTIELLISGGSPQLKMADTTASAKSLLVKTDANVASLYEAAGAVGDILSLDLANKRVGVGTASPSTYLHGIDEIACTSAGTPIISCGLNTTNGGAAFRLRGASSGNNNWQMANNFAGGFFEITPSTAAGGNTYTTPALTISNGGLVGIGINAAKSKLHIEGASGWIIADEQDTDPTSTELDSLDSMAIYMKSNKFVIAYNNGGTMTYISIPMDGSTTTWTHNTSAP